jgi:hypothetical protein
VSCALVKRRTSKCSDENACNSLSRTRTSTCLIFTAWPLFSAFLPFIPPTPAPPYHSLPDRHGKFRSRIGLSGDAKISSSRIQNITHFAANGSHFEGREEVHSRHLPGCDFSVLVWFFSCSSMHAAQTTASAQPIATLVHMCRNIYSFICSCSAT